MPHERKRHIHALAIHVAKLSPLVGILGHRQVGKTTLLEHISSHYLSLDDEATLVAVESDPVAYLKGLKGLGQAIDECQLCARLFPALKERVRKDKRPGQFYLSGSVRFTSKKTIRESLTGRIMALELLPMTLSELDGAELPNYVIQWLESTSFKGVQTPQLTATEFKRRKKIIDIYLMQGGLPGACFIRDLKNRQRKIRDQLDTILSRDLREIQPTTLANREVLQYVRALALKDGGPINNQELRRETGITPITQKKLLYALEGTFILRMIPLEGDAKGSAIFFEDQAEALELSQNRIGADQQWVGLVYRCLREQIFYSLGIGADFFQYRSRSGSIMPLAIRGPTSILGVLPIRGALTAAHRGAVGSFLRKYVDSKVVIINDGTKNEIINDRTILVPAAAVLF